MAITQYQHENKRKLLSWGSETEEKTIEQALKLLQLPFIHKHVALMADAHVGKGSTIGSVIATKGAIIPAAVGVDIGCGMVAVQLELSKDELLDRADLNKILLKIEEKIPSGMGKQHKKTTTMSIEKSDKISLTDSHYSLADSQLGTLGSGNHFIEICADQNNQIWLMVHSGSRGVGNKIASKHISKASKIMQKYFIELPDPDLAYFVQQTDEFSQYMADMWWLQDYAKQNRLVMVNTLQKIVEDVMASKKENVHAIERTFFVDSHHNYINRENFDGQDIWVTRKGAVSAYEGEFGIIPGSMATGSYIVEGKGSKASFCSCSHGAGRRMSRTVAFDSLTEESLIEEMQGKIWLEKSASRLVDEHPFAYKDLGRVMEDQTDLVDAKFRLECLLNYKGL